MFYHAHFRGAKVARARRPFAPQAGLTMAIHGQAFNQLIAYVHHQVGYYCAWCLRKVPAVCPQEG